MSEQIKVTVVMPVYNAQAYLRQCLDSVMKQTLKDFELICVDDGSTDDSLGILREYEAKYRQVRVLTQKNEYAGCARNRGLEAAEGTYVVFWDSDDFFEKRALEQMYRRSEACRSDICVCDAWRMDDVSGVRSSDGGYLVRDQLKNAGEVFSKADMPAYIFTFTNNAPWNKMYRRSFLLEKRLRFQALAQANDLYFVMTAFYLAERICILDRPLLTYRMGNQSSLTGRASRYADCASRALEAVWQVLEGCGEKNGRILQSFANRAWFVLLASLRQQSEIDRYRELYGKYKDTLLEKYHISGHESGYIYHTERERALQEMLSSDCDQFLLLEMRYFERESRLAQWRVKASLSFRAGNAIISPAGRLVRRIRKR